MFASCVSFPSFEAHDTYLSVEEAAWRRGGLKCVEPALGFSNLVHRGTGTAYFLRLYSPHIFLGQLFPKHILLVQKLHSKWCWNDCLSLCGGSLCTKKWASTLLNLLRSKITFRYCCFKFTRLTNSLFPGCFFVSWFREFHMSLH
jgi:hypothetical protein